MAQSLPSKQAADYIGMSESWLRKSRLEGASEAPPHLKIGRAVRYLTSDLDHWLAERRHVSAEVA